MNRASILSLALLAPLFTLAQYSLPDDSILKNDTLTFYEGVRNLIDLRDVPDLSKLEIKTEHNYHIDNESFLNVNQPKYGITPFSMKYDGELVAKNIFKVIRIPEPTIHLIGDQQGRMIGTFPIKLSYLRIGLLAEKRFKTYEPNEAKFKAEYFEVVVTRGGKKVFAEKITTPYVDESDYMDEYNGYLEKDVDFQLMAGDQLIVTAFNVSRLDKPFTTKEPLTKMIKISK